MKLLSASLLVLWSCLVHNVQQSCANHWPPSPEKALASVSENGSFPTPDSILTTSDRDTPKASSDATGSLPDHQVPRSAEVATVKTKIAAMEDKLALIKKNINADIADDICDDVVMMTLRTDELADKANWLEKGVTDNNRSATLMLTIPAWEDRLSSLGWTLEVNRCLTGRVTLRPHDAPTISNTRTATSTVTFSTRFSSTPSVSVAIEDLDVSIDHNIRINTFFRHVTTSGFQICAHEWDTTRIYFVVVSWVACCT